MKNLIKRLASLSLPAGLVLLLALSGIARGSVQKKPDSLRALRKARVAALLQAYPGVKYGIDDERGVPWRVSGKIQEGLTKGDPAQTVYEFFEKNRELYGLTDPRSELKVDGVSKDELGTLVVLRQRYRDVEVWNTMLKANFGRDGNLYAIYGSTYPDIDLSPTPSIDSLSAMDIVKKDFKFTPEDEKLVRDFLESLRRKNTSPIYVSLTIAAFKGAYRLCWAVTISRLQPNESYQYFVDAHTGVILQRVLPSSAPKDASILKDRPRPTQRPPAPSLTPDRDSALKPQGTPKPQSEEDLIILSPENYKQIPASKMDSIRAAQKGLQDSAAKPGLPLTPSEIKSVEESWESAPGIRRAEPVEVRLERPLDSLIQDLDKRRAVEKAGKKQKEKRDSSQTNMNASPATFVNIMTEGFEGFFPEDSPNWYPSDNDVPPELYGEYYWDDDDFLAYAGSWSGWCAGGGSSGVPGSNNYANNMNSWMVYGPFSLADAVDASFITVQAGSTAERRKT